MGKKNKWIAHVMADKRTGQDPFYPLRRRMMGPGCWWGHWGHEGFFGMPVVGMVLGIIFWLLVLYAIFVLVSNALKRRAGPAQKEETGMDILKKRYARGEIDAEEFARKKKDLES